MRGKSPARVKRAAEQTAQTAQAATRQPSSAKKAAARKAAAEKKEARSKLRAKAAASEANGSAAVSSVAPSAPPSKALKRPSTNGSAAGSSTEDMAGVLEMVRSMFAGFTARKDEPTNEAPTEFFAPETFFEYDPDESAASGMELYSAEARRKFRVYLVVANRYGLRNYESKAVAIHHDGFRSAIIAEAGLTFAEEGATLVGYQPLSELPRAMLWIRRDVLSELTARHMARGSANREEVERLLARYFLALELRTAFSDAVERMSAVVDSMSEELVLVYGRRPLALGGVVFDPAYTRERVYWRRRIEALQTPEAVQKGLATIASTGTVMPERRRPGRPRKLPAPAPEMESYQVPSGFSLVESASLGAA